jgi:DNA-binding response OmpR family regulator
MGGRELRERLTALGLSIPVLFMSAYTGDEVLRQGLIEAGDAFVQKPFTPAVLTARVREALDSARGSVVGP